MCCYHMPTRLGQCCNGNYKRPAIWVLSRVEDEHAQAQAQDDTHNAGDDNRLDAVTLQREESSRMQRWAMKKLSNQDGWEQRAAWLPSSMAVIPLPRTHTTAIPCELLVSNSTHPERAALCMMTGTAQSALACPPVTRR